MLAAGLAPDEKTLTALLKIYRKARWGRDALELWERMRANKWPVDLILYNTLLSVCADFGLEEEAESLFVEVQNCLPVRPDDFTYTSMIKTYCSVGKVDSALEMLDKMLDGGVKPNVMGCTCLMQCLGRAKRIDDAVRVFDIAVGRGIKPDDRICGCLLSLASMCCESEMTKVLSCLERASPRLVMLIRMLGDGEVQFAEVRKELRSILNDAADDVRKPFCNCLIDICRNRGYPSRRGRELLYIGTQFGLYSGLQNNGSTEWSLNLRSLSVGAAKTAFEEWMMHLSDSVQDDEALPLVLSIRTGNGDQRSSQGLCSAFSSYLKELAAPFSQSGDVGCFVAAGEDVITWARSKTSNLAATA
ncbi:hypothetical protein HPP92_014158 [Vanilla planifolia]|uniref:Pentatricopeptide repeat-containing protein n=1 Tax=Vanilla planifolia TaxID=51239 RepID=A0A835UUH6_VANPL|nr:hypothetical protein HPP92_014589 [Vanilla planifolia]KAG0474472.1 hypothetical protein HPP92_014158 [Vanilla planifolia]